MEDDIHSLTGLPAEMRAHLLAHADIAAAAAISERVANIVNDIINGEGVSVGTSLLARALVANGVLDVAAHWWASDRDPRATVPVTTAVMRSIITDLPLALHGESYLPRERG